MYLTIALSIPLYSPFLPSKYTDGAATQQRWELFLVLKSYRHSALSPINIFL